MEEDEEPELLAKEGESVFRIFKKNQGGSIDDYAQWEEELKWDEV